MPRCPMPMFPDILSQPRAIEAITRAYTEDRLPHGLLFAGPVGVGKATTAAALGQLFLCEHPKGISACRECPSCKVFAAGNHPDWHVVYKELIRLEKEKSKAIELPINVVRQFLLEPASRKSILGRGKVFVVEQAELMSIGAQNAMLKTLEEPAGRTLIILLTDQPNILLPTIRSRCQLVQFAALPDEVVLRELHKRGIEGDVASAATQLAEGSLGLAIKWVEDSVVQHGRRLQDHLRGMMSGGPAGDLPGWFRTAAEEYAQKQLARDELSSKDQATREALGIYLRIASQLLRRELASDSPAVSRERLCSAVEALVRAEQYLDANVTIALIFQQLAVTLESLLKRET